MPDVDHAHEVKESLHGAVIYPGHPPRKSTPEYEHTHHQLVYVLDKPCMVCGVRESALQQIKAGLADGSISTEQALALNPRGATLMETHHYPLQDSLVDAVDWRKVHQDFPQVVSQETLLQFLDSAGNMYVLCNVCHIGYGGIHNTSANYWIIQRYLVDGYQLFDEDGKPADLAAYESVDDHLAAAMEAAQSHAAAAATAATSPASPTQVSASHESH